MITTDYGLFFEDISIGKEKLFETLKKSFDIKDNALIGNADHDVIPGTFFRFGGKDLTIDFSVIKNQIPYIVLSVRRKGKFILITGIGRTE